MSKSLVPRDKIVAAEVGTFGSQKDRLLAEGYEETFLSMSNFDHTVDQGFAEALQGGKVYGRHAAWDFNGIVWWDGEKFAEEVWVYRSPAEVMRADSLEELMEAVSNRYGYE